MLLWRCARRLRHRRSECRGPDLRALEKELEAVFRACRSPFPVPELSLRARRRAFRRLRCIVKRSTDTQLSQLDMQHLLWAALGAYCFFRVECERASFWRRMDLRASRFYLHVVQRVLQGSYESHDDIVGCVFAYLSEYSLWSRESLAVSALLRPLVAGASGAVMLELLLDRVNATLNAGLPRKVLPRARQVVRVMYELFDFHDWPPLDERAAQAISRLLKMYRHALRDEFIDSRWAAATVRSAAAALRKGLELTIRRIFEHMVNADLMTVVAYMVKWIFDTKNSMEMVLTFGLLLEHAAMVHAPGAYVETFVESLFPKLLELVGSNSAAISLLANRVLQHLLDRHDNRHEFASPRIYFQNMHFNVHVAECLAEDRVFLGNYRQLVHRKMMRALLRHSDDRFMLESLYTTLCLLATEVPCGYTAAAVASLAMDIQAAARDVVRMRAITKFHLHALVMSLMSLLCWLHNAPHFYNYVNKVIDQRAEHAPHLNPPLRASYTFAQHHARSTRRFDKAGLFFDEWEVRYGLWMRFRVKHAQTFLEAMGATAPPTPDEVAAAASSGLEPSLRFRVRRPTRRQQLQSFLPARDTARDLAAARGDTLNLEDDPRLLELALETPLLSSPFISME